MIRLIHISIGVLLLLSGSAATTRSVTSGAEHEAMWQPEFGLSWQIQFSESRVDDPLPVQVYDLDGFETGATTIAALHAKGIRVLCYMDMGTWEDWRPDAAAYPAALLGNEWADWPGERYVDIRRLDLLEPILSARLDLCAAKGFDAVEPDNIDTYGNDESITGFTLTEADQLGFDRWLAAAAHARGLAIGQKNGPELTPNLIDHYDFAVTEDCLADGWCDQVRAYLNAGKPVFAIEYTDRTSEADFATACAAQTEPFSLILKHRELDAWRVACS